MADLTERFVASEQRYFRPSRDDGRSDARVVTELMADAPPGTLFEYDELRSVLERGLPDDQVITRQRIAAAARKADAALQKHHQRALHAVVSRGYRLAEAKDHGWLAQIRETKSRRQLRKGLSLLVSARLDEMDETHRNAHLGHLVITQALWSSQERIARQQRRQDEAIAALTKRLDALEEAD